MTAGVWRMLSIAVCDDEMIECARMAGRIRGALEEMKVPCFVRQFNSGRELLGAGEKFDIVFLDILMDGLDGMKTAGEIRQKDFCGLLIFVSSSREYVFDAYEVEAFWYLTKPVEEEKLKRVLYRAVQRIEAAAMDFILINRERQKQKIFLEDILYFEIRGRLIDIHKTDGVSDYYGKISVLEKELAEKGFFRCHKSYLVHLNYVKGYNRQEITMESGEKIPVSKRRYEAFCKALLTYMKKSGGIV